MERAVVGTRRRHGVPPRRPDHRRDGVPRPARDTSRPMSAGTSNVLEVARCHDDLVRRVVVASSDKAYGEQPQLPYTEDMPLDRPAPLRGVEVVRRPRRPGVRGDLRGAGRDRPLRQHLRRRRPQLDPDRPRDDPIAPPRRATRAPQRRHLPPRLPPRRRRRGCLPRARRRPGARPTCAGATPSTSATSSRSPCGRSTTPCATRPARAALEPLVLGAAPGEIHDQYLSAHERGASCRWKPRVELRDGLERTVAWYSDLFRRDTGVL